jgi:hypothetical protein
MLGNILRAKSVGYVPIKEASEDPFLLVGLWGLEHTSYFHYIVYDIYCDLLIGESFCHNI